MRTLRARRCLMRSALLASCLVAILRLRRREPGAASGFDGARAYEHLRDQVAIGPRVVGHAGQRQDAPVHHHDARRRSASRPSSSRSRPARRSAASRWPTSSRRCPAQRPERIVIAQPLRHQAVQGVPLRRRQRRRIEHGRAARARARAQGPSRVRSPSSCCSSTARKPFVEWSAHRSHLRQPLLRARRRSKTGTLGGDQGVHPARHDRRPRSEHPARSELDAVADRRHLGGGAAPRPQPHFLTETTPIEDDHLPFLKAGVAGGRHHRSRLPRLAHRRRHAGQRQRAEPADRRRCRARRAAGDRTAAAEEVATARHGDTEPSESRVANIERATVAANDSRSGRR